jgi:hypothetical protein
VPKAHPGESHLVLDAGWASGSYLDGSDSSRGPLVGGGTSGTTGRSGTAKWPEVRGGQSLTEAAAEDDHVFSAGAPCEADATHWVTCQAMMVPIPEPCQIGRRSLVAGCVFQSNAVNRCVCNMIVNSRL